jgi:hypothetical protein
MLFRGNVVRGNVTRGSVFSEKCSFREMVRGEMNYGELVRRETIIRGNVHNGFSQWCIDSGMQLYLGKCKSMSFTRSRFTRHFQYELSCHKLDNVDFICDLGVVLDSKLHNFTSHIDSLLVKASRMLGYIRRIGKEFIL